MQSSRKLNFKKRKKIVLLLSGGIDSSTCALYFARNRFEVFSLFIDYGQVTVNSEYRAATRICHHLKINPLYRLEVSSLKDLTQTALCGTKKFSRIDNGSGEQEFFPNRNLILLSLATIYAADKKAKYVGMGILTIGQPQYPDTTLKFIRAANKVLKISGDIQVITPFSNCTKFEVVRYGRSFGLDYNLTFSCNINPKNHCGKCCSCSARQEVLKKS